MLDLSNKQYDCLPIKYVAHINENKITTLNLRKNKFRCLQLDDNNIKKNLIVIDISYNFLNQFPDLNDFSNLTTLNLSNNSMNKIPSSIHYLTALVELDITKNSLKEIPKEIFFLKSLAKLMINENLISNIEIPSNDEENISTSLTELDLSKNRLISFPSMRSFKNLKRLFLRGNKIKEINGNHLTDSLICIDMADNELTEIPSSIFFLPNIDNLQFCYNKLTSLEFHGDTDSPLRILCISNNKIKNLPQSIKLLKKMQEINLSQNFLESLPQELYDLSLHSLEILNIEKNNINSPPKLHFNNPNYKLKKLQINHNLILHEEAFDLFSQTKTDICDFYESVPQKVIDGIYIGSAQSARNIQVLKKCNITHILNIATKERHRHFPTEFIYKVLNLEDSEVQEIFSSFDESHCFIDEAINSGGILIHCLQGISRSSTIVISYLMKKKSMRFQDALDFVISKRKETNPNYNFMEQLRKYDSVLFGN